MNALNNVKIGAKIAGGYIIVAILLVAVAVIGFLNMKNFNDGMTTMYFDQLLPIQQLGNANAAFYEGRGELYKFILIPDEHAAIEEELNVQFAVVDDQMKAYSSSFLMQTEKDELVRLETALAEYRNTIAEVLTLAKAGDLERTIAMMAQGGTYDNSHKEVSASLDKLITINLNIADETNRQADVTFANSTLMVVVVSAIAVILAMVIGIVLTRGITSPLTSLSENATQIGNGDLSVNLPEEQRRDEIGLLLQTFRRMIQWLREMAGAAERIAAGDLRGEVKPQSEKDVLGNSFARMLENLRGMTADISEAVNLLGSSASEILAATTQVASSTAETATAISETTTTVEELRQAAQLSSQKAQVVSESAQRVAQATQSGQKAVGETTAGMERIREQMETIAQTVVSLSEQSQSIGGIIATVNDLADQSNLLAVNASIEAAKAGEQGRGFAVVAQEIKSLAEQSKQATAQVRGILSDVQKVTGNAVMATEQGSIAVEAGVKQSAQAGEAIRVLAETVGETVQATVQIATSREQQVVGMDQIGTAMENINQAGAQTLSLIHI